MNIVIKCKWKEETVIIHCGNGRFESEDLRKETRDFMSSGLTNELNKFVENQVTRLQKNTKPTNGLNLGAHVPLSLSTNPDGSMVEM